jgi:hypothetical protein
MGSIENIQNTLEAKTRRWSFFVGMLILQCVAVPYASKNFAFSEYGNIIRHVLRYCFWYSFKPVFPFFQVAAIVFVVMLLIFRNKVGRIFSLYAGICYILFNITQSIAINSPKYGLCIATVNLVMFGLVAGTWIWEAIAGKNDFSTDDRSFWKYLVIPPAVIAFWAPAAMGKPDFNPVYFLTSGSALAFCPMTPVFMAVLIFFYPRVNMLTLRMTGVVGTLIGIYNVIPKLILGLYSSRWDGILHLPLLVLSAIGLVLSMKKQTLERIP